MAGLLRLLDFNNHIKTSWVSKQRDVERKRKTKVVMCDFSPGFSFCTFLLQSLSLFVLVFSVLVNTCTHFALVTQLKTSEHANSRLPVLAAKTEVGRLKTLSVFCENSTLYKSPNCTFQRR